MDKLDYNNKAHDLLSDRGAYQLLDKDPMVSFKNQINKVVDKLKRQGKMDEEGLRMIRPRDSAMARFYGLPKIHKTEVPLRPIVSLRGTPTFGLAKWLHGQLQYLVEGTTTIVTSSMDFLQRLKGVVVGGDEIMVSFDVISLFTSIPQELAIQTIQDLLLATEPRNPKTPSTDDLIHLLKFCLKTYFTFNGQMYEQTKGTPMGSPISGVIAEAVLQRLEQEAMTTYKPKFWARYVDDTFTIIKQKDITRFMGILNSIYPDIQFTMEEEANNKLAFLDVQISRNPDGSIDTEVYRKATSTDRILHKESNHPNAHKVSCIRTLFGRIDTHCSTRAAKVKERAHLYRICTLNGYSKDFIQRCITPRARQPVEGASGKSTWRVLPYIQGVSETAARILAPHGVKVAHKPDQTLRKRVMRPKETLPKEETSSIIYRINCSNCASHYIGETSKRLKTRVHEHKLAVRRNEQRSQIWMHMEEHGHKFNFQETEVIARDETKGGRLLKEAWYSNNNSLNRHIDMPPAYQALRHQEGLKEDRRNGDRGQISSFRHRNWPNEGVTNPDLGQDNMLGRPQNKRERGGGGEEQRRPITRSWAKQMGLKEATCVPQRHNNEGEGGRGTFKAMPVSPALPPRERKGQYTMGNKGGESASSSVSMTKVERKMITGGKEGCGPVTRAKTKLISIT